MRLEEILASIPVVLLVLLAAIVLVAVACIPLWMILRHLRLVCENAHAERMKAMDAGCPLADLAPPQEQIRFMVHAFWIAFWIGAVFPAIAVCAAAWATRSGEIRLGFVLTVWCCVAAASLAGVVCGTVILLGSRPDAADARGKLHTEFGAISSDALDSHTAS